MQSEDLIDFYSGVRAVQRTRKKLIKKPMTRLWVDAICINQSDLEERSSQVSIMKKIYQRACIAFAWLGIEADSSDVAMSLFSKCAEEISHACNDSDTSWLAKYSSWCKQDLPYDKVPPNAAWYAVNCVLKRVYWTRVRTFNELFLSWVFSRVFGPFAKAVLA